MTGTSVRERKWHTVPVGEVFTALETSPGGLTDDEARRRLARHGPNVLEDNPPPPAVVVFLRQFASLVIAILLFALALTVLLGEWLDAAVIAAALLVNAVIGFVQERRADRAVRALADLSQPRAQVVRDGRRLEVDSADLVPGDVVLVESGSRVPADIRLVEVHALEIDESLLTGESEPAVKTTETADGDAGLGDRPGVGYSGTLVASGRGTGVVYATGTATQLGAIAGMIKGEPETATPLKERMGRLSRVIAAAAVGSALLVMAIGLLRGGDPVELLLVAVALAVAAVPEGLPIVLTVALAVGVTRMARRNAVVRRMLAVEALGSATVIGSDKTGTLTENRMVLRRLWTPVRGELGPAAVRPYRPGATAADPERLDPYLLLLLCGALTNEAETRAEDGTYLDRAYGDPTEVALLDAAHDAGLLHAARDVMFPKTAQVHFEPARRFSATARRWGEREVLFVKGAPERVLAMCDAQVAESGTQPLRPAELHAAGERMAGEGLRLLALAMSRPHEPGTARIDPRDPTGLVLLGLVGIMDPPRQGVRESVRACRTAGIRVVMITGDHATTARAIAAELGICEPDAPVLTHDAIAAMDDAQLRAAVAEVDVYARIPPEGKLRLVRALEANGEVVAVTGDGVNDAPALKAASVGVAMGRGGTDVAREAADIVLADDDFTTIVHAVEEGRVTFDNIRRAVFFLVSIGAAMVLALTASTLLGWPLLMVPAQLLWLNLVTSGLQDIALVFERAEPGLLRRPPRPTGEGVLSPLLWQRIGVTGAVMAAGTLAMFWWEWERSGSLTAAQTVALTTMVVFMAFQAGNARSATRSLLRMPPRHNPFLAVATLGAFALHVAALYFPPTQVLLRVEPMDPAAWWRLAAVAAGVLVVVEIEKAVRRALSPAR
ncbi:cation-translocating P-type ATPase [Thermobifida cellulosilytica]|uniref:ATPase n=1 Tax=Thermobifida cellulosilytica TB100 TaxID=665004 RepID=A0A147KDM2_THECS|nr:HAD-IC family P-type ATPase [Thermobifida cellulosilytica]KUP95349.1 ATPase [Thermobifida cellulosilytica TB100]